jgi:hypothetical protein
MIRSIPPNRLAPRPFVREPLTADPWNRQPAPTARCQVVNGAESVAPSSASLTVVYVTRPSTIARNPPWTVTSSPAPICTAGPPY